MLGRNKGDAMKIQSAPFGLLLSVLLLVPGTPARAQTAAPAAEVVWSATNDFGGKMMDIDRFDNVYSVGDTIVGGIVLTRKFNPDGFLLWERTYRPDIRREGDLGGRRSQRRRLRRRLQVGPVPTSPPSATSCCATTPTAT